MASWAEGPPRDRWCLDELDEPELPLNNFAILLIFLFFSAAFAVNRAEVAEVFAPPGSVFLLHNVFTGVCVCVTSRLSSSTAFRFQFKLASERTFRRTFHHYLSDVTLVTPDTFHFFFFTPSC